MNAAPAPLYLLLSVFGAAYVWLALTEKRGGGVRVGYALVSFFLLLCGQAVLSYGTAHFPSEVLVTLSFHRSVTAILGAWLGVMAAGELGRAVLAQRPPAEALGPGTLLLAGVLLMDSGVGAGVGLGLATASLAAVSVGECRRAAPTAEHVERSAGAGGA